MQQVFKFPQRFGIYGRQVVVINFPENSKKVTCGKFGKFCKNFFFANSVKRHICNVKNSQLRHDLHISVNERVILPFREDFIFTELRICEVS